MATDYNPDELRAKRCAKRNAEREAKREAKRAKREAKREALTNLNPHQVLPFNIWIDLADVSRSTGLRILDDVPPPPKIRLSERRFGIRFGDHVEWLDRLARKAVR